MKRLLTLAAFVFIFIYVNAQDITLYGFLPSDPDPEFLRLGHLDPITGSINDEDSISPAMAYALGSSTFDAVNNAFMFIGVDTAFNKRLYTRGIRSNTIYDPLIGETINDLQYDMNSTNTYGLGSYIVDSTLLDSMLDIWIYDYGLRFLSIDQEDGTVAELKKMPDLTAFPLGSSTFDANNGRYIINAYDTAFTERLVILEAETGNVLSKDPVGLEPGSYLNNLEYNNEDDKLYGFYRGDNLTYFALISIDIADGYAIDTIYTYTDLLYFIQGAAVFDQASQSYIMFYIDDDGKARISVVDVTTGELVANPEYAETLTELEVDNTVFAVAKYHGTVDIPDHQNADDHSIYPNPAGRNGVLHYRLDFIPERMRMLDLYGRMVMDRGGFRSSNGHFGLKLSQPGVYVVVFEDKTGGRVSRRVSVQ